MRVLDEDAGYAEIINHPFARYEQYGRYFNVSKVEVDPQTGEILGRPEVAPEIAAPEMSLPDANEHPSVVQPTEPEPSQEPETVIAAASGPVPGEIEGLDLTEIDLHQAHWQHLRQYLKAFGQEYEGRDQAMEYLEMIQKMQRGEVGEAPAQ